MGILEKIHEDESTYYDPEPYQPGSDFYFKIAENWVPGPLRQPLEATFKVAGTLGGTLKRRKIRKVMR